MILLACWRVKREERRRRPRTHAAEFGSERSPETMETMIVTGGAGFIGSNFVRYVLANTDVKVVVVDKLTYAGNLSNLDELENDPRYAFVQADIADRDAVEAIFRKSPPTSVVNFAAETHVDRSIENPDVFFRSNTQGVFELLEASRKYLSQAGRTVADDFRFLHVSTDEVYGTLGDTGFFSETTPYAPNSPYSASKASADHFVRAYHETYGLPTLVTNCSNNYGPYQFPEKLIPLMILNCRDGKSLPIYGDGGNIRDWLYVEDHCDGIVRVLQSGKIGGCYNIGGENERTNLQVVDKICALLAENLPPETNSKLKEQSLKDYSELKKFVEDRPGHDRRYAIDATKIRRDLGWQPRWGFDEGMARTVRWYLENTAWCEETRVRGYDRERLGLLEKNEG